MEDLQSETMLQGSSGKLSLSNAEAHTDELSDIISFKGPNDPENPLNWKKSKKHMMVTVISLITLLSSIGSTIISSGAYELMQEFHSTNKTLESFVTTVWLLGYAFGPLVIAPLSELYGRNILYQSCCILFLLWNVACALAPNLSSLICFRLLAGIAGSCPVTIGAGSIADIIPQEHRGAAMAGWVLGPLLGPMIGPIIAGYVTPAIGWRWNFWIMSIASGVMVPVTLVVMRESNHYVILKRKSNRIRKQTGNYNLKSSLDNGKTAREMFSFSIVRPLKMLVSPIIVLLSLYASTIYAYLYLCLTTFPHIFGAQYGFNSRSSGLVNLGFGIGSLVGLGICGAVSDKLVALLAKRNKGEAKPEYRLPTMVIGAFIVPIGLFMYAWTAEYKVHWAAPIVGTGFLGCGMVITVMATSTYLVDSYTAYAASAMAASTVFRSVLGALLPLAGNALYDSLGVGWGMSLLGFIAIAFIPLPFVFFSYGEKIRESKRFEMVL